MGLSEGRATVGVVLDVVAVDGDGGLVRLGCGLYLVAEAGACPEDRAGGDW